MYAQAMLRPSRQQQLRLLGMVEAGLSYSEIARRMGCSQPSKPGWTALALLTIDREVNLEAFTHQHPDHGSTPDTTSMRQATTSTTARVE